MEQRPFSLRIFVVDGDPDGLRIVERSNWVGRAVVFPRALFPRIKSRPEFDETGVYLLIGPRQDGEGDMLYIGEGDPVKSRLESHFAKKDFWTRGIFFIAGKGALNKAHVQFLEARLVKRATDARRLPLDNGNAPADPTLHEADVADMSVFLDNMLGILPVLGVSAFETGSVSQNIPENVRYTCTGKGVTASGLESTQGFVVEAGSEAVADTVPSMREYVRGFYELRQELIRNGVLIKGENAYRFSQNFTFASPSAAAAVVLGRSANGRIEWKTAAGATLKAIQEQQSAT